LLSFYAVSPDASGVQAFDQIAAVCSSGKSDPGWSLAKSDKAQCDMSGLPARLRRDVRHTIHFPNVEALRTDAFVDRRIGADTKKSGGR